MRKESERLLALSICLFYRQVGLICRQRINVFDLYECSKFIEVYEMVEVQKIPSIKVDHRCMK